jgi:hypothetical protein
MNRHPGKSASDLAAESRRRLRQRNWALLAALLAFVGLVYAITIVKMSGA